MELDSQAVRDKRASHNASSKLEDNLLINLYKTPPFGTLTLEECEDLFRQRLEAYHTLETLASDGGDFDTINTNLKKIKSFVYKTNCVTLQLRKDDLAVRKQDHFSHMLARMFCVYQPALWQWFKVHEKKLFYFRLRDQAASLSGYQLESILNSYNFDFERVGGTELNELRKENIIGWNGRDKDREIPDVFKVKFIHALKFISKRSVSLKDGYAYLTRHEIISVVCDVFERHLDNELIYARQHLNLDLLQTQQLLESLTMVHLDFLDEVAAQRSTAKRDQNGENHNPFTIEIDKIDNLASEHFPPCMRYMHESLRQDHHLKHQGRLYYGAFLRTGGVDMDTAVEFWRAEFTKNMANDKFERNYKYNIRHLYGKEGHKKALTCFSCDKIINDNSPGPLDKHGCPFRHFDETNLRSLLTKHGLKEVDIESLINQTKEKEYKTACSHYFKYRKGKLPSEPIKNPSHYYYESMRFALRPPSPELVQDDCEFDDDDHELSKIIDQGVKEESDVRMEEA